MINYIFVKGSSDSIKKILRNQAKIKGLIVGLILSVAYCEGLRIAQIKLLYNEVQELKRMKGE